MRDVSCRTLAVVLKAARRRAVPDGLLVEGTPYDLAYLRNPKNHIEWSAWCQILRNARSLWTLDELSKLNEAFMRSSFTYVGVIARLLFTSRDLFDWICKRQVGGGAQLFGTVVKPSYEHVGADVTVIRLEIQEPHEISEEFFAMTRGAFIAMPRLVGAGDADVELTRDGRCATPAPASPTSSRTGCSDGSSAPAMRGARRAPASASRSSASSSPHTAARSAPRAASRPAPRSS
jgi:hypothetical protein